MVLALLLGVLALAIGGCACVVWASRGGPRWARAVATVTLAAADLVRGAQQRRRRGLRGGSGGDGGDGD
ncbi:hypothetical protein ACFWC9_18480 [Streptomyces goshikiensis]|uniref:hypothetical protein n=1 Tax=Streptomyces goshikiensis TaxID=1942 RepID=UPI0036BE0016